MAAERFCAAHDHLCHSRHQERITCTIPACHPHPQKICSIPSIALNVKADVYHVYQVVRANEVPVENIILFAYEDIAHNPN
ncbi:hypothetical protein T265_09857 [Opisthorchis viverrini]|uniref:Uncharacterized protein n=1 Tax=Opisthorchis viverrini TaxID=6198 RepID=A0A075A3F7_OPIVI|nr:hypothetical protein T265_09857 [Opisthorchis viverrini]KER21939.1 hypothetical protein T265_09857 [Opisthorchis viverrini]